ncbi:ABC transporter ATP-binding protein [Kribbella solani]|uniref:ABC transporter ATP-binding protein n=1 Tax=Kribbella solani TaxID=236067 RepID=UPI0029A435DA|nr:ABC transporter ATP-binding protein [Kribbella solani]MDX3006566.1 ABC transporter ATP-binding protein [Kribbella solani]
MSSPLIDVLDLTVRCGDAALVDRVSLTVETGERLGIVGETGSGKSLTCRALVGGLARLGMRAEGRVVVAGEDVVDCTTRTWNRLRRESIGFVPQSSLSSLDPVMRIGRQLGETVALHVPGRRDRIRRVRELVDLVHLAEPDRVLRAYPHQLSGGMRQRIMIAMAVAGNPSVLVADEPTTALDVSVQRKVLDLLDEVCREQGMALILVTHDLGVVAELCDKVVVMRDGGVVESGLTAEVLRAPESAYTRRLLDARLEVPSGSCPVHQFVGTQPDPGEKS